MKKGGSRVENKRYLFAAAAAEQEALLACVLTPCPSTTWRKKEARSSEVQKVNKQRANHKAHLTQIVKMKF